MTPTPPTQWTDAARVGARIGHDVEAHATIGSTSDRARMLLDAGGEGVAVVADEQTSGRGRHGRRWLTPPGRGLAVSVGIRPGVRAVDGWQLALGVGLAAREACDPRDPRDPGAAIGLKWPNDLVAPDGRKVGGILVETTVEGDRVASAVVGIGINVDWPAREMPDDISGTAASLVEVLGHEVDRIDLLRRVLAALEAEVEAVEAGRSPIERYRHACRTLGSEVRVETGDRVVEGRAVAIGDRGELVLDTVDGMVALDAGEVVRAHTAVWA